MDLINENLNTYPKNMYEEKLFCDVTIRIGDSKFELHKSYLSSCNQYFKNLFSKNFNEGSQKEIELKEISPHIFQYMIEFLYLGKTSVKPTDLLELHLQSTYFMVKKKMSFEFFFFFFFFFTTIFFFFLTDKRAVSSVHGKATNSGINLRGVTVSLQHERKI